MVFRDKTNDYSKRITCLNVKRPGGRKCALIGIYGRYARQETVVIRRLQVGTEQGREPAPKGR